ncbi:MAG: YbaB/EbfC family nucleoid-associated protein [Phycisphaerae bacterium]|nr:YbaB/EbfC family nucleoid-associated protein [Phycisphaerae bacterium]
MLDKLRLIGSAVSLMRNTESARAASRRIKEGMDRGIHVGQDARAGVQVTLTGYARVLSIRIDPSIVPGITQDPVGRQAAEALIAEAVNDAIRKAKAALRDSLNTEVAALGLPPLPREIGDALST